MAIFVNQTQGYFLLTNFKVMYSSLSFLPDLQEIFLHNYLDYLKFKSQQSQKQTIMLVRNPYTKLISFFEDKFIRHPNMSIEAKFMLKVSNMGRAGAKTGIQMLSGGITFPVVSICIARS